jgi:hypothetical protein
MPGVSRFVERGPGVLFKFACGLFAIFAAIQLTMPAGQIEAVAVFLFLAAAILLAMAFFLSAVRADRRAESERVPDRSAGGTHSVAAESPPLRPLPQAGHRKWKPDVYDENAYAILGVAQDATAADLRQAFKT